MRFQASRQKDVGAAVAKCLGDGGSCSATFRAIKKLKAYKTLHYVLQHVQIERYRLSSPDQAAR